MIVKVTNVAKILYGLSSTRLCSKRQITGKSIALDIGCIIKRAVASAICNRITDNHRAFGPTLEYSLHTILQILVVHGIMQKNS